ncbi:MAG: EF-P lysine aminoacylase EpmA [Kiritimatiellia bacterium]|nr:EF-P lysine aminoacylase EpmA [Kiritimatiellia bacterium]
MQHSQNEQTRLAGLKPVLELRAKMLSAARNFFREQDYLEAETPVLVRTPALELHIDAFPVSNHYLRTSPELHMKRLLCAGYKRIFQIGPCFRSGEQGNLHNPEFTMLEWYRADADYMDILAETKDLLKHLAKTCLGRLTIERNGKSLDLGAEWQLFSVPELFEKFAGWNPVITFDERRFDEDMVNCIEPNLPVDRPVVLLDYPAQVAALARLKTDDCRLAERWELYLGGVELANAFSELTDANEQRKRFEECARKRRAMGKPVYELDSDFLAALEKGLPPSAGVALGLDRLVMLFAGVESLDDVLPFR